MLSPARKALHAHSIGSSEIAAVAGLHPYASAWDVWASKTVGVEVANDALELGELLEEPIAQFYARRHPGVEVRRADTLVHPLHPWAVASPDRLIYEDGRLVRLLEVKTAGLSTMRSWGEGGDEIPEAYICQVVWQLCIAGLPAADVAALVAGAPRFYRVERNDALAAFLLERGQAFMDMLGRGERPELDGSATAQRWLRDAFPDARRPLRDASPDEIGLVRAYAEARAAEKAAGKEKARLGQLLALAIGDAEGLAAPGARATYRRPDGASVEWKAVAEALAPPAELIALHSTPLGRRLDVHVKGPKP